MKRACLYLCFVFVMAACAPNTTVQPTATPTLATELVWYNWAGSDSQSIMDEFEAEYGVKVRFEGYTNQEEAVENIRAGKVYDVVHMSENTGPLLEDHLLAPLNLANIPNFANVPKIFRNLAFDPGNQYSVPYSWGTAGVVYRSDLFEGVVTRWDDLWHGAAGQIGIW